MRDQLINELKETSYWDLLFRENTIIAYFGGSELIGFKDERSDFDIMCITSNQPRSSEYSEFLMWNDKKVHFIYRSIDEIQNFNLRSLGLTTLTQMQALKYNNSVFLNNCPEVLDELLASSDEYLRVGFEKMSQELSNLIEKIVTQNAINDEDKTKYLYHLVYAKRKYFKEPIEEEYLRQLKRIRWQPVEDKYIQMCIEDLKVIYSKVLNSSSDIATLEEPYREFSLEISGRAIIDNSNIYTANVNTTISPRAKDVIVMSPSLVCEIVSYDNLTGAVKIAIKDDGSNIVNGRLFGIVRWNK